jgi:tetratricopeptide (TPR) repeat protein
VEFAATGRLVFVLVIAATLGVPGSLRASDVASSPLDPCVIALLPHKGIDPIDREISKAQDRARETADSILWLERLGWLFTAKARRSYDPGYWKLAEQCGRCIAARNPHSPEALLLLGHVLDSLHRFHEAELMARELVAARGLHLDWGLLGDALMEQGRLAEAVDAYQKMIDLKPGPQSYSRAAHVRWLKGNLRGAIELARMAARASDPRDADSSAWSYSRLALYELQAGDAKQALETCEIALQIRPDHAETLLVRGRILLAGGNASEAIRALRGAAALNPLPEYRWMLAEALREGGLQDEAIAEEVRLVRDGAVSDPRTLALFLATRGRETGAALNLTQSELKVRADVFTLDALAWALHASGRANEARDVMRRALAEGTADARLFYHAGVIAAAGHHRADAQRWLGKADAIRQMLLPSERAELARLLVTEKTQSSSSTKADISFRRKTAGKEIS